MVEYTEGQGGVLTAHLRYYDPVTDFSRAAELSIYDDFEPLINQWRREADGRRDEVARWRGVICQQFFEQMDTI